MSLMHGPTGGGGLIVRFLRVRSNMRLQGVRCWACFGKMDAVAHVQDAGHAGMLAGPLSHKRKMQTKGELRPGRTRVLAFGTRVVMTSSRGQMH